MDQGEELEETSSKDIDYAILQTDILEGDMAKLWSLMTELEWKTTERIHGVQLESSWQVGELERII